LAPFMPPNFIACLFHPRSTSRIFGRVYCQHFCFEDSLLLAFRFMNFSCYAFIVSATRILEHSQHLPRFHHKKALFLSFEDKKRA
jgi:hypothetical protein